MTDNVQLLKQLDASGADLNAQYPDRFNWTPLITAIYFQNTNAIAYLLNRGVDVRKRDASGKTALMMAITCDDTNTATLLFRNRLRRSEKGRLADHTQPNSSSAEEPSKSEPLEYFSR